MKSLENTMTEYEYVELTGFEIIKEGFNEGIFSKNYASFYARKLMKLIYIGVILLILSSIIIYFVYDVGYNTSNYKTEGAVGFYEQLSKNNNHNSIGSVLTFFVQRQKAIVVYIGMVILLFVFIFTIFKRLSFLWSNFVSRFDIDDSLIYAEDREKKAGYEYIVKDTGKKSTICNQFIIRLHNSFRIEQNKTMFSELYNNFKISDEEQHFSFENSISNNSVWIIRLGIFGTLLGISIAFFELYEAIGLIKPGESLKPSFIVQVQQALLGNAIAVITSLAAHGATLFLEIGVSYFLRDENNASWLETTYNKLLEYPGFSGSLVKVKESVGELNSNLAVVNDSLDDFAKKITASIPDVVNINTNMSKLNSTFTEIHSVFDGIQNQFTKYEKLIDKNITSISKTSNNLVSNIDLLNASFKTVSENTGGLSTFVRRLIESIKDKFRSVDDDMDVIASSTDKLSANLESIENNVKSISSDTSRFGKFIKGTVRSIAETSKDLD